MRHGKVDATGRIHLKSCARRCLNMSKALPRRAAQATLPHDHQRAPQHRRRAIVPRGRNQLPVPRFLCLSRPETLGRPAHQRHFHRAAHPATRAQRGKAPLSGLFHGWQGADVPARDVRAIQGPTAPDARGSGRADRAPARGRAAHGTAPDRFRRRGGGRLHRLAGCHIQTGTSRGHRRVGQRSQAVSGPERGALGPGRQERKNHHPGRFHSRYRPDTGSMARFPGPVRRQLGQYPRHPWRGPQNRPEDHGRSPYPGSPAGRRPGTAPGKASGQGGRTYRQCISLPRTHTYEDRLLPHHQSLGLVR